MKWAEGSNIGSKCIDMTPAEYVRKQLKATAITGIPQIIEVRGVVRKLLKSVVFVVCVAGCVWQIWSFMEVFWTYPIIVDVMMTSPKRVPLPAVTACPYNGISASTFCEEFPEFCTPERSLSTFCTENSQFCFNNNREPNDSQVPALLPSELPNESPKFEAYLGLRGFYKTAGVSEDSFVDLAVLGKKHLKPEWVGVFNAHGLPTNCYAFNTLWGNASAEQAIVSTEKEIKLSLVVDTLENFYENTPKAIQVAVHSSFEQVNPFRDGFSIKPCTSYKIYIKRTEKNLLPAPYQTNCTDYMKVWKDRGGVGPLSEKACGEECLFNKSMERYGCFNPKEIFYPNNEKFCFDSESTLDEEDYTTCAEKCSPACYSESMQVEIEEFIFPENGDGSDDSTGCATQVDFSFIRMEVITFSYKQKYESVELFGYVGGYLGMWLGMSLVALCDFIETCVMMLLFCMKNAKRKRKASRMRKTMKLSLPLDFPSSRIYSGKQYM